MKKISKKPSTSPQPGQPHNLSISSLGLPEEVNERYASVGVIHMFSWQADCLRCNACTEGSESNTSLFRI